MPQKFQLTCEATIFWHMCFARQQLQHRRVMPVIMSTCIKGSCSNYSFASYTGSQNATNESSYYIMHVHVRIHICHLFTWPHVRLSWPQCPGFGWQPPCGAWRIRNTRVRIPAPPVCWRRPGPAPRRGARARAPARAYSALLFFIAASYMGAFLYG